MSLILNIDTATDRGSVSLADNGFVLAERINEQQKDHAAWIQVAIKNMMESSSRTLGELSAVAVVAGPGSYTGLRVAMATAKGLCYVFNIPLIQLNTLLVMSYAVAAEITSSTSLLLCPMLDARRMEVFTALYDTKLNEVLPPRAMVLESDSFADWEKKHKIVFFGNGSGKWKPLYDRKGAGFSDITYSSKHIASLSYEQFKKSSFTNLTYAEPIYLKEFHTYQKN